MNLLNDMLERCGEVRTQKAAGKILNMIPRTISRMMEEVRLRRMGRGVDVGSICEYFGNPRRANFTARAMNTGVRSTLAEGAFLTAARSGEWTVN